MACKIITITREFGSGGRTIGHEVAERLGWDFYDWNLVEKIAREYGYCEEFVEENGEESRPVNPWLSRFGSAGPDINEQLFLNQRKVILDLAEKGNCVIVGRCADYILENRKDVLNVFIWASDEFRRERIVNLYGETEENIEKRIATKDKKRKSYYQYYTGRKWGSPWYYQMCLESSGVGVPYCVDLIVDLAEKVNNPPLNGSAV